MGFSLLGLALGFFLSLIGVLIAYVIAGTDKRSRVTCCSGLMTTQLILGIMNPIVMVIVAIFIAAEKLLPRPAITARLGGIAAIVAGIAVSVHWITVNYS